MTEPNTGEPTKLADLTTSDLDQAGLDALLKDIELLTTITEIIPKFAPQANVQETANLTLAEARVLLNTRAVRGLQIRYQYDGGTWWDTFMNTGTAWRLIRIRHDFNEG